MSVRVLFFGATAEIVGNREIAVSLKPNETARNIFAELTAEYPQLKNHNLLLSINQEFADGSEAVHDGDELAIFTAVSGG